MKKKENIRGYIHFAARADGIPPGPPLPQTISHLGAAVGILFFVNPVSPTGAIHCSSHRKGAGLPHPGPSGGVTGGYGCVCVGGGGVWSTVLDGVQVGTSLNLKTVTACAIPRVLWAALGELLLR